MVDGLPIESGPGVTGYAGDYRAAIWVLLQEDDCSREELADRLLELGLDWRLALNLPFVLGSMQDEDLVTSSESPETRGGNGGARYSLTAQGRQQLRDAIWLLMRRRETLDVMVERYMALRRGPLGPVSWNEGQTFEETG